MNSAEKTTAMNSAEKTTAINSAQLQNYTYNVESHLTKRANANKKLNIGYCLIIKII